MTKKISCLVKILCFSCFASTSLFAQQLLDNAFYVVNPYAYNSSQAGNHVGLRATVQFSGQNSGLPSSPRTTQLMLDGPINNNVGLGARVFNQQWGAFKNTTISGDTSYKADLSVVHNHYFRFGVGIASQWRTLDYNALNQNGYTNMADPSFQREELNQMDILVGGGAIYHFKTFEASFSVPYLFSFYNQGLDELIRSLVLAVGYDVSLQNDLLHIKPTVLINPYSRNMLLYEGMLFVDYQRLFWAQVGYRASNDFVAGAGFNMRRLKVGYSLIFPFGNYAELAGVEHAVVLFFTGDKSLLRRLKKHNAFIEKHIGGKKEPAAGESLEAEEAIE